MTDNLNCNSCQKEINLESDAYFTRRVDWGSKGQELKKPYRLYYCLTCSGEVVP